MNVHNVNFNVCYVNLFYFGVILVILLTQWGTWTWFSKYYMKYMF